MWEILTFVLNAVLFLLVGLQLPAVLDDLTGARGGELAGWAVLISGVVDRRALPLRVHDPVRGAAGRPARGAVCRSRVELAASA